MRTCYLQLSASLFFLFLFAFPQNVLAKRLVACVKADGKVVVKRRCKSSKGESQLNLSEISNVTQGPVGPKGDTGPKGDQGSQGPKGDQGPPGITGHEEHSQSKITDILPGGSAAVFAYCPSGLSVIAHRCVSSDSFIVNVDSSKSSQSGDGRYAFCHFSNSTNGIPSYGVELSVYLICAPLGD